MLDNQYLKTKKNYDDNVRPRVKGIFDLGNVVCEVILIWIYVAVMMVVVVYEVIRMYLYLVEMMVDVSWEVALVYYLFVFLKMTKFLVWWKH